MAGLSKQEIVKLVNRYIGVSGGYLGDFSYRTHIDFYAEFCDLDINPSKLPGTTRERFLDILETVAPHAQAQIVRGTLLKYPPCPEKFETRTQQLHDELLSAAMRIEGSAVGGPVTAVTCATVERAIRDAEMLIKSSGATSGVDRVHTALHGYLKAVCRNKGIISSDDATITALFKLLREQHPAFAATGARSQDITQVLRGMAQIMDAMNPVRNNASMAHPNQDLLEAPEAMLVINAARTILHFLDQKLMAVTV